MEVVFIVDFDSPCPQPPSPPHQKKYFSLLAKLMAEKCWISSWYLTPWKTLCIQILKKFPWRVSHTGVRNTTCTPKYLAQQIPGLWQSRCLGALPACWRDGAQNQQWPLLTLLISGLTQLRYALSYLRLPVFCPSCKTNQHGRFDRFFSYGKGV